MSAVDVVGGTREWGVRHEVDGEPGDVVAFDNTSDRQRRAQLIAALFELIAGSDADSGVSTRPRATVNGGIAAVAAEAIPRSRLIRRPPVPPVSSSVPPGLVLPAALHATSSAGTTCSLIAPRT